MRLLTTHSEESNRRLRRGLKPHGVECVSFDAYGRSYDTSGDAPVGADVGLVYPSRLVEGGVVDALCDIRWVNGSRELLLTRNKAACIARLASEGLPVPDTRYLSSPVDDADVRRAFEEVGSPAVIKPNSTSKGRGVVRVGDADAAAGVADYLGVLHESSLVFDRSYLVQEFVEDARDYRVMVVEGDYVGAVERRSEGWKHNVDAGATACGVEPPDGVVTLAERAARALDVEFAGIDVLYGDEPLVNEVNARPTVDERSKYEPSFYERLSELVLSRNQDND